MRRANMLVLTVLGVVLAVPVDAEARAGTGPGGFLGGVLGVITLPLRMLGAGGHSAQMSSQSHHHHGSAHHRVAARSHAGIRMALREPRRTPASPAAPGDPGATGPQIWPTAFDDMFGYAVAPGDYADRFWSHGYGDVIDAMLAPVASAFASEGRKPNRRQQRRLARADGDAAVGGINGACGEVAPGGQGLTARMLESIELSEPQRRAFEEFRTAFADAMEKTKATCGHDAAASPSARVPEIEDRLTAVQYAVLRVRGPLNTFYESLTPAQKDQFERRASPPEESSGETGSAQADRVPANTAATCGARDHQAVERLLGQIQQEIRPTSSQRPGFEALRGMLIQLDHYLTTSCPETAAGDPVSRLDAAGDRITDFLYAVQLTRQVLNGFLATLDQDQQAKFGTLTR